MVVFKSKTEVVSKDKEDVMGEAQVNSTTYGFVRPKGRNRKINCVVVSESSEGGYYVLEIHNDVDFYAVFPTSILKEFFHPIVIKEISVTNQLLNISKTYVNDESIIEKLCVELSLAFAKVYDQEKATFYRNNSNFGTGTNNYD